MEAPNLSILLELATAARDAALARHARLHQHLAEAQAQLALLRQYAADYAQQAQARSAHGGDPAARTNWHHFALKLDEAIAAQASEADSRAQQLAAAEAEVQAALRKLKSLQALAERRQLAAQAAATRRDQKQTDETARGMRAAFSSLG